MINFCYYSSCTSPACCRFDELTYINLIYYYLDIKTINLEISLCSRVNLELHSSFFFIFFLFDNAVIFILAVSQLK
jgi:hypothetical protein